ncbi:hypothetical protein Y10_02520 [Neptunitalea sp. Y10]|uniref:Uncharacterized protein n=1 Tax=Neptunitalea lumnitzerae TaxID=2965509 RepID=A0ABQ5MEQ2_9FLAO|nr:hypothetical protein Y10_02520 [Neptunitalea sp. Y10]
MVACDSSFDAKKYPQQVTKKTKCFPVHSCYATNYNDFSLLPKSIRNSINNYLADRLGDSIYTKVTFNDCTVYTNIPKTEIGASKQVAEFLLHEGDSLPQTLTGCDSNMAYPIYSALYTLHWPEKGIERYDFCIMLDKYGAPVLDIALPSKKHLTKLLPINTVIDTLIHREIPYKNTQINLYFDRYLETLLWEAALITEPCDESVAGCTPKVKHLFTLNAYNGKVMQFDPSNLQVNH